jgi:hypothetical protein
MINYFLVEDDIFIDREMFLVNDFINLRSSRFSLLNVFIELKYTYIYL